MKKFLMLLLMLTFIGVNANADILKYGWKRILDKATYDIAVSPQNPNILYVGGNEKTIYISRDGGNTWETHKIGAGSLSARYNNIMANRADSNILIVGGIQVDDVARTSDNGQNWNYVLGTTYPILLNGKALVAHPTDNNVYYLAEFESGIIYKTTNKGETWDSIATVFKPTKIKRDNGEIVDTIIYQQPTCLAIRPDSAQILLSGNQGGGVLMSKDEGKTWNFCGYLSKKNDYTPDRDNEVTMFSFNEKNPLHGYAVITYTNLGNLPNGGVWKTTDGGYSWDIFAYPDTSFWAVASRQRENGEDEVFVGGYSEDPSEIDSNRIPGCKIVRGTFDSGRTWWTYDPELSWLETSPRFLGSGVYKEQFYLCGDRSRILDKKTTLDSMWNINNLYEDQILDFNDIAPYDSSKCIVVGENGRIFMYKKSTLLLKEVESGVTNTLKSVIFIPPSKFVVCGAQGTVITSEDRGDSFNQKVTSTTNELNCLSNYGDNIICSVGENGVFIKSTDGGNSWTSKSASTKSLYGIKCISENTYIACGQDGIIVETTDAGNTWNELNSGTLDTLYSVDFKNANEGMIVGNNRTILKTINSGLNWRKIDCPITQHFYSINYVNDTAVYAVGSSQTAIQSFDSGEKFNVTYSSYGPIANMWSMRYLGAPGQEKLYMATEAGLFVAENMLGVIDNLNNMDPKSNLNFVIDNDQIVLTYKRAYPDKNYNIRMSIVDINGRELVNKDYNYVSKENIFDIIPIKVLSTGSYIIDFVESDKRVSKVFIK